MRILLVQFKSDMLTKNEDIRAKEYFDKLYRTRRGYNRFGPVWEIPQWIAQMKRNFDDADILFAESLADIQSRQKNYSHLAFSALDCNWHLIRTIAQSFSGTVIVGGYCDIDNLQDLPNVVWCHSVQECCEILDVEHMPGINYQEFAGRKTIGRLSLSSGCLHKCKFCIVPDVVTKTPIEQVYQQADEICRLSSPLVYLDDKTFGQCENFWLLPHLFGHIVRNMSTTFDGFIIQTTASQLLKLDDDFLAASGVRYVELGVETYNDTILRQMNKPANEKLIAAATAKLRRLQIKLIPNLLIGLPNETADTYSRTLNWLSDNKDIISHINVYNLVVYETAELADEIEPQPKDFDENSIDKSWHIDNHLHKKFADKVYAFGMTSLDK